ncbi:MAG: hypothetical protein LUI09_00580 [Prevotellaceae bacterium]|nr:hypothetical protein [Prevotellaceae bacterium]
MKNRLSKLSGKVSWVLVLLAACGVTSSCKDEYTLDDEKPSWLNSSIYASLEASGDYTNYLRLLADPDVNNSEDADNNRGLVDILSKTGSKTVFVANDDAWADFFAQNAQLPEDDPWHTAVDYESLSASQKKLLIHTSMLNNAIVMENLASSEGTNVVRGEYMRRYTDVEATDSITHLDGNSIPVNYNEGNEEADYWSRFRTEKGGNGLYLVADSSLSMMIHFTSEYLTRNSITDDDFAVFMGQERVTSDVHIYDAKVLSKDEVCENGYVNVTEKVLKPLPNMAELLRTNGQTRIFSHMLDRWSAPFYNAGVTQAYKNVMAAQGIDWTDSIFSKRYFSDLSWGHSALLNGPQGEQFRDAASTEVSLKYDPGWNAYYDEKSGPQYDMAAMYVPTDEVLWTYFTTGGGGWQLIQTYCDPSVQYSASHSDEDYEKLFRNIDQIPISTLRSLINVIMFTSFVSSVPSKMTKLRDDAQEQIFYADDLQHIVGSLLACNGIIYLTDKVYGPADYTSVAAPAYISTENLVMRWAIYNGSTGSTDYMGLNYYAYLKAMQSRFVFFLPSDAALNYLYDPVSFKSKKPRVMHLFMKANSSTGFPIDNELYAYEPTTGEIGRQYSSLVESVNQSEITNRLKDILESHTIVIEDGSDEINSAQDEYYVTKNGSGVRVIREGGKVVKVQGGFQAENEAAGLSNINPGVTLNQVTDEQDMSNGTTYILDSPIVPSARSVFNILTHDQAYDDDDYERFYELCEANEDIIRACGLVDEQSLTTSQQKTELKKYQIFVDESGPDYSVEFFNNYRYTIFVPTKDAINAAVAAGLPSWDDIEADFNSCMNEDERPATYEDSLRLQTKITYLTNFLRYHFIDNSVFVDKSDIEETEYVTASYDNDKGLFCKVILKRQGGTLYVEDNYGGDWHTAVGNVNVMARDMTCNKTPNNATSMAGITIDGSSFAVLHQIDGVLNHTTLEGGRYDSTWADESSCKRYLEKFAIH